MIYNWGYVPYYNPYYVAPVNTTVVYNYSQPIPTAPVDDYGDVPEDAVPPAAMDEFDQAREAFREQDYPRALKLVDAALEQMPSDAVLHEFRSLTLFAMGEYQQAAGVIYAVLSAGPGWDWTTMSGLYADPATYTEQLRKLEAYCKAHPDAADARFLLAYHYITCGHAEAAAKQLKKVVELNPNDQLSAQLLRGLTDDGGEATAASEPPQPPESQPQPEGATLDGNWTARRGEEQFDLQLTEDGKFKWSYTHQGKTDSFEGMYTAGNGLLTLLPNDGGGAMVGTLSWDGPQAFNFRMAGGPPNDPGLDFQK